MLEPPVKIRYKSDNHSQLEDTATADREHRLSIICRPNSCEFVEDNVVVINYSNYLDKEDWFAFIRNALNHPALPEHYSVVLDLSVSTDTYPFEEMEERSRFWMSFRPRLIRFAVVVEEVVADTLGSHVGAVLRKIGDPTIITDGTNASNFSFFQNIDKAIQWAKQGVPPTNG
jgi:hypothetical protein